MRYLILAFAALGIAAPALAQAPPASTEAARAAPAFDARVRELLGILGGTGSYEAYFTPGFRTAVPKATFDQIGAQVAGEYGKPLAIEATALATPWSGTVHVRFERAILALRLNVEAAEPHQVSGLRILGPVSREKTLAEVAAALDALPGTTGYAFAKLGSGAPRLTLKHNADKPLAVGSAFKLVILAELVRATNAGQRKWDDMVTLDGRELPGGGYTMKPAGAQVSLRELATKMISISDNSATDILLGHLGREKVEAMLDRIGVRPDPRNRPYLSTLEAFKLKWLEDGALADRFNTLDEAGQRRMLTREVAAADITPLMRMTGLPEKPSRIDTIEWFFTPADMIRVIDWLRRNSEGPNGADARAVLSKNPGLAIDKAQYGWVGFKGGSEPGLINLTLLLQGADGAWYAATGTWNNVAASVDDQRFVGLMTALVKFAGPAKP
ncbi:serine hydrolase [Sphingomonas sp.]|jgi:beta-lactamase class A|uniref:serine hydrolase n=1 Tax=Sphingomonas sp. TaxID=28214 RepID=UPI002EDB6AE0